VLTNTNRKLPGTLFVLIHL